jgi:hypothetical protein
VVYNLGNRLDHNFFTDAKTMLYRPNFCCNSGEKIERVDWSIFTSRKFCDLCQTEFRAKDLGPKLLAGVGLLFLTAIVSSVFGPAQPKPKVVSSEFLASSTASKPRVETNLNTTSTSSAQSQTGNNVNTLAASPQAAGVSKSVAAVRTSEAVYYCGAATKKGTACSRRVKRPGERCWQHQGMPSIADDPGTARK